VHFRSSSLTAGSIVLAGLLVGCGSGSSSSGGDSSTEVAGGPKMARYIAAADVVCEAENERLSGPGAQLESTLRAAQKAQKLSIGAAAVRSFAAEIESGLTHFETLQPPAAQRAQVEAMLATEQNQVDLLGELAGAFEKNGRTAAQVFETRLAASKQLYGDETAKLGFKVCGARSR